MLNLKKIIMARAALYALVSGGDSLLQRAEENASKRGLDRASWLATEITEDMLMELTHTLSAVADFGLMAEKTVEKIQKILDTFLLLNGDMDDSDKQLHAGLVTLTKETTDGLDALRPYLAELMDVPGWRNRFIKQVKAKGFPSRDGK